MCLQNVENSGYTEGYYTVSLRVGIRRCKAVEILAPKSRTKFATGGEGGLQLQARTREGEGQTEGERENRGHSTCSRFLEPPSDVTEETAKALGFSGCRRLT